MKAHLHIPTTSQFQEYVAFIWEVEGEHNVNETILPQGVVEIVFNFADAIHGVLPHSHTVTHAPRCFMQGVNTHVINAHYVGQHHLLGTRLHPHRVRDLLGILPAEVNNITLDLTLIKPDFNRLWHQLIESASFSERIQILQQELPILAHAPCERSQRLCQLFISDGVESFETVDELARQVCYSPRQLNRIAHQLFGLPADELTTYKKFMEAVKLMHTGSHSLTHIAYLAGFYDQAHFCRIFKSYTGITPKQYKNQQGELPFHILT